MMGRPWTDADDRDLERLRGKGWACSDIGEILDRSTHSVMVRASKLGIARRIERWTETEDSLLGEMRMQGHTAREIGEALGRSRSAVEMRVYVLGLAGKRAPRVSMADKAAYAARLKDTGMTSAEVAREMGISVNRVYALLRLAGKPASKRKWSDDDMRRVADLRAKGLLWRDIAEVFGGSTQGIARSFARHQQRSKDNG